MERWAFDFDMADSGALFTSIDGADAAPGSPGGSWVPEALGWVIASGVTMHDHKGFSGSLRLRYFGPRHLTSDTIYRSNFRKESTGPRLQSDPRSDDAGSQWLVQNRAGPCRHVLSR